MKIALYGKSIDAEHCEEIKTLLDYLFEKKIELFIHNTFKKAIIKQLKYDLSKATFFENHSQLNNSVSFLLSIGGDGTFLDTILLVRNLNIPILGINTGRLGFLSNTPTSEVKSAIDHLISGKFTIEKRSLLRLDSESNLFGDENHALNEISIMKRDSSSMITIHTEIDGNHLNSYWTDGLIISTATGSTAYSLSCGGPIMMPDSGNFVITPIAPHNLNVRPIVIDDDAILKVSVESRVEQNLVAMDSRSKKLKNHEILQIQKADYKISIVQLEGQTFVNSLKNKLNWGLDKRNL